MQDDGFASEYAEDHPNREDVTESYVAWFAVRYRADRMSSALTSWIERAIAAGGPRRGLCVRHVPGRRGGLPRRHRPELTRQQLRPPGSTAGSPDTPGRASAFTGAAPTILDRLSLAPIVRLVAARQFRTWRAAPTYPSARREMVDYR